MACNPTQWVKGSYAVKSHKPLGHMLDLFAQRGVVQAVPFRRESAPAFTPSFTQKFAVQLSRDILHFHG
jgi:hypothetical protein